MPLTPEKRADALTELMVGVRMGNEEALKRIHQILVLAYTIGEHWRDQDGINAKLLDLLADATTEIDALADMERARG